MLKNLKSHSPGKHRHGHVVHICVVWWEEIYETLPSIDVVLARYIHQTQRIHSVETATLSQGR